MIYFDCEKMRYRNTGLYYFCYYLGKALTATDCSDRLGFLVPKRYDGIFGENHKYLHRNARTKYLMPGFGIDLWHSCYQLTHYLPWTGPILQTIHDLNFLYEGVDEKKQREYVHRIDSRMKRFKRIVAISDFVRKDILDHIDTRDTPIDVIYNGCNKYEGPVTEPSEKPSRPFLFTVGTVLPKKNFHVLPCLLKDNDYELIIAGNLSGYINSIIREAEKWGVKDRVRITGPISEPEKHWYLSHCMAFLFPSIAEGFGLPPIEAMQYGKPVFLSTHTCLPEIGGDKAYYFNHEFDRDEMRREFQRGMDDYLAGGEARQEAIKAHAAKFDWDNTARQYAEIYKQIINEE